MALGCIPVALEHAPRTVLSLIRIDAYSLVLCGAIVASSLLVTLLCGEYLRAHEKRSEAFYPCLPSASLECLLLRQARTSLRSSRAGDT